MCISFNLLCFNSMQVKNLVTLIKHLVPIGDAKCCARDKAIQTPRCLKVCHVSVVTSKQLIDEVNTDNAVRQMRDSEEEFVERCHTVVCYSNCSLQRSRQKWEESTGVRSHSLRKCYLLPWPERKVTWTFPSLAG